MNASDIFVYIILTVSVILVPLLCAASDVPVNSDEYQVIRSSQVLTDYFSYNKGKLLITCAVVLVLAIGMQIAGRDGFGVRFKSLPVILCGVLAVIVILTALFSKYHKVSLQGATERYEGLWVWLSYLILFTGTLSFCDEKYRAKKMLYLFAVLGILTGIIGFGQAMGKDIFTTEFASKLIMGDKWDGNVFKLNFTSVFGTFYNPNCAGMFYSMLGSFSLVYALFAPVKNKMKYVFALCAVLLCVSAVKTDSIGGIMGLVGGTGITMIIALLVSVIASKNYKALSAAASVIVVLIVGCIFAFNFNPILSQKLDVIRTALSRSGTESVSPFFYEKAEVSGKTAKLYTKAGVYSFDYKAENTELLLDDTVLDIDSQKKENNGVTAKTYLSNDIRWVLSLYDNYAVLQSTDKLNNERSFLFGEFNSELKMLDKFYNPVEPNNTKTIGFKGLERLGSNRGYIWSRSIPLLFKHIILGSGPDTFVLEFPQNDVYSKLEFLNNPYVILDKPHNLYLQLGINFGLVFLVVFIVLIFVFAKDTVKAASVSRSELVPMCLAICAGILAYLITGLTTDSVVSVSPTFWCLLGCGFGCAHSCVGEKDEQTDN